jgi:hypothetical protein
LLSALPKHIDDLIDLLLLFLIDVPVGDVEVLQQVFDRFEEDADEAAQRRGGPFWVLY